jgi:hypothetical protein
VTETLKRLLLSLALVTAVTQFVGLPTASSSPGAQNVTTQSRQVRCMVNPHSVICQRDSIEGFPNAPLDPDGYHMTQAIMDAGGPLHWNYANVPATDENDPSRDTVLSYGQTFRFYGWTISPSFDGTRFTNDQTGHGIFVSIDGVSAF